MRYLQICSYCSNSIIRLSNNLIIDKKAPKLYSYKSPSLLQPLYNFIPKALATLILCLILKSNMISSLPPGIA